MLLVYKVLSRFVDYKGEENRLGTYVLLDPDKVKQKYRRGCLLLARDQEGARKIVGHPDPRKFHEEKKEEDNLILSRVMHKQKIKEADKAKELSKQKKGKKDVKKDSAVYSAAN